MTQTFYLLNNFPNKKTFHFCIRLRLQNDVFLVLANLLNSIFNFIKCSFRNFYKEDISACFSEGGGRGQVVQ